jgi:formiminotetrahydrofolate cyclodeaminase
MAARRSVPTWADAPGMAAQAVELRDRLPPLAAEAAETWAAALTALASPDRPGLADRLDAAAATPLLIAETSADVAALGAAVADRCDETFRGDAVAATLLAAAAARAAAHLVEVNLTVGAADPRRRRAEAIARRAGEAASRVLDAIA